DYSRELLVVPLVLVLKIWPKHRQRLPVHIVDHCRCEQQPADPPTQVGDWLSRSSLPFGKCCHSWLIRSSYSRAVSSCCNSDMNCSHLDKSSNCLMPCSSRRSAIAQANTPFFRLARLLIISLGNPSSPRLRS